MHCGSLGVDADLTPQLKQPGPWTSVAGSIAWCRAGLPPVGGL